MEMKLQRGRETNTFHIYVVAPRICLSVFFIILFTQMNDLRVAASEAVNAANPYFCLHKLGFNSNVSSLAVTMTSL